MLDKQNQHRQLEQALKLTGYEVIYCPLILGHGGTVYKSNHEVLLKLGLRKQQAQKLLTRLSQHAIRSLLNIITQRRLLERGRHYNPRSRHRPP